MAVGRFRASCAEIANLPWICNKRKDPVEELRATCRLEGGCPTVSGRDNSGSGMGSRAPEKELVLDYARLMRIFRRLALEAGERIMEIREAGDFGVKAKTDASPVTRADEAADALIGSGLAAAFPNILAVTEEQAASHGQKADTFIIADPLDGTREFIAGRDDFTVNIALVEGGVPTRGTVYAPAREQLFMTDTNGSSVEEIGPFGGNGAGRTNTLAVSNPDNSNLTVVASKSHRDQATEDYIAKYRVGDSRAAGSSLKFCLVAAGEADLYPRMGRTMEWDTAAGDAILRGAGGRVVRLDDHAPLTYGKPGYENPPFVAHAPGVELKRSRCVP